MENKSLSLHEIIEILHCSKVVCFYDGSPYSLEDLDGLADLTESEFEVRSLTVVEDLAIIHLE